MFRVAQRVASVVSCRLAQVDSSGAEGADGGRGLRPGLRPDHRGTALSGRARCQARPEIGCWAARIWPA